MNDQARTRLQERIREDFYALMATIHKLRDYADQHQDKELQSIILELGAQATRAADTDTLRMYVEEICGHDDAEGDLGKSQSAE